MATAIIMSTISLMSDPPLFQGNIQFRGKEWDAAIGLYTRAIELDRSNVALLTNRSAAFMQKSVTPTSHNILIDRNARVTKCMTTKHKPEYAANAKYNALRTENYIRALADADTAINIAPSELKCWSCH